eukprot:1157649-Pelagomonas_calceolata.AAC.2
MPWLHLMPKKTLHNARDYYKRITSGLHLVTWHLMSRKILHDPSPAACRRKGSPPNWQAKAMLKRSQPLPMLTKRKDKLPGSSPALPPRTWFCEEELGHLTQGNSEFPSKQAKKNRMG